MFFDKMESLGNWAREKKNKLTNTEFKCKLLDATQDKNWNARPELIDEICKKSHLFEHYQELMDHIWECLSQKEKKYKSILRTLSLMEYVIKLGAERCTDAMRSNIFKVRKLMDFQYIEEGVDKGQTVRQKTKRLVELLSNKEFLQEEREQARNLKKKMKGSYSSTGSNAYGSITSQGGNINSNQTSRTQSNPYSNYSSKKEEDVHQEEDMWQEKFKKNKKKPRNKIWGETGKKPMPQRSEKKQEKQKQKVEKESIWDSPWKEETEEKKVKKVKKVVVEDDEEPMNLLGGEEQIDVRQGEENEVTDLFEMDLSPQQKNTTKAPKEQDWVWQQTPTQPIQTPQPVIQPKVIQNQNILNFYDNQEPAFPVHAPAPKPTMKVVYQKPKSMKKVDEFGDFNQVQIKTNDVDFLDLDDLGKKPVQKVEMKPLPKFQPMQFPTNQGFQMETSKSNYDFMTRPQPFVQPQQQQFGQFQNTQQFGQPQPQQQQSMQQQQNSGLYKF